ncbi:MAG: hypothetical protein HY315_04745 [Acidobacteria bacterium]|nr:hypothetical protein [Acidobacteriota bacterium]
MRKGIAACALGLAVLTVAGQQKEDSAWEEIRRTAETQHEIVALCILKSHFNQVLPEMRKVYSLKFPEKYESMLSQEIEIVSDQLMHQKQYQIAHQVIDEGLVLLKSNKNKAAVLKKKAYILKKQGREEEALQYFKQSVALESVRP